MARGASHGICIDEIGLVENDEIGAGNLVFEKLGERGLVIDTLIGETLGLHRFGIGRETPRSHRLGIGDRK